MIPIVSIFPQPFIPAFFTDMKTAWSRINIWTLLQSIPDCIVWYFLLTFPGKRRCWMNYLPSGCFPNSPPPLMRWNCNGDSPISGCFYGTTFPIRQAVPETVNLSIPTVWKIFWCTFRNITRKKSLWLILLQLQISVRVSVVAFSKNIWMNLYLIIFFPSGLRKAFLCWLTSSCLLLKSVIYAGFPVLLIIPKYFGNIWDAHQPHTRPDTSSDQTASAEQTIP